jgi:acetyl-CoA carboxylase biotin carboxylase subunit
VPSHYDSMLAKLIVYATTRDEAIMKMKRALGEFVVDGVITNVDYHFQIMENNVYKSGLYDTGFIENSMGVD